MAGATAADNFLWFPKAAIGGLLTKSGYNADQPKGETTDALFGSDKYKGLEITDFSFGAAQSETAGSAASGAGAGKAKFEDFTVNRYVDTASVPLYIACVAGAHFPTVYLVCRKAGGSQMLYLQWIFRMVFVTSISWSGGGGDETPKEAIKFKFGAMGIQYCQQTAAGTKGTLKIGNWSGSGNQPNLQVKGLDDMPESLDPMTKP